MGDKAVSVELKGIDEVRRAMAEAAATIRKKAVRGALREAAKVIQAEAKTLAPVLAAPTRYRKPGTVAKNIAVRASKFARQQGNEGVFVNVRPIRGAARIKKLGKAGARNPNDPFYWWFLEFGTKFLKARRFMRTAADSKGGAAIEKFMSSAIPQIEKLNAKAAKQ